LHSKQCSSNQSVANMKLLLSAILLFNFSATFAKIVFLMGEKYEDCSTGGSYKFLDYSGLEYEYENDTAFFLTGLDQSIID